MTVPNSKISWCTGTLNLTVGCTKVSSACENCYAEELVERLWKQDFGKVVFHAKRLADLRKFQPAVGADGFLEPKMVFVNSLSDFWHEQIPDSFIDNALDSFEANPKVIIQILTKRPVRARKHLAARYKGSGIPPNFWLGVSAEDNRTAARINILRRLKDQVGEFCAFVSVEPIVEACDKLDFTGIDWVLTGGESRRRELPRPMPFIALEEANEKALGAGIALHFKQYGHPQNNPYAVAIVAKTPKLSIHKAFALAIAEGQELAPHEKGGATYKGRVIQEKPPHFYRLRDDLNRAATRSEDHSEAQPRLLLGRGQ